MCHTSSIHFPVFSYISRFVRFAKYAFLKIIFIVIRITAIDYFEAKYILKFYIFESFRNGGQQNNTF